jgi:hypothetical protein
MSNWLRSRYLPSSRSGGSRPSKLRSESVAVTTSFPLSISDFAATCGIWEETGREVGTAAEFLGLTDDEAAFGEMKLSLSEALRERRTERDSRKWSRRSGSVPASHGWRR